MLYIEPCSTDPHYNLAFEESVFSAIAPQESMLMLWQNEPSVIVGHYQNTIEEINPDYIETHGVHVVRRMTGGGAVYHDLGNLNYSLIVPTGNLEFDFKTFTAPLVETLRDFGVRAEQTGRNDVTIEGKKFSGNAQHHAKGRLLHHGTILFNADLTAVSEALRVKAAKIESKSIKSVRSRVTNIVSYLKEPVSLDDFRMAFVNRFRQSGTLVNYTLSPAELSAVSCLADKKYRQWDWNYGKSPACNLIKSGRLACGCIDFHMNIKEHRIQSLHIFGDFFCSRELSGFTSAFDGVPYNRDAVSAVLSNMDASIFFQNIRNQEILDILF